MYDAATTVLKLTQDNLLPMVAASANKHSGLAFHVIGVGDDLYPYHVLSIDSASSEVVEAAARMGKIIIDREGKVHV